MRAFFIASTSTHCSTTSTLTIYVRTSCKGNSKQLSSASSLFAFPPAQTNKSRAQCPAQHFLIIHSVFHVRKSIAHYPAWHHAQFVDYFCQFSTRASFSFFFFFFAFLSIELIKKVRTTVRVGVGRLTSAFSCEKTERKQHLHLLMTLHCPLNGWVNVLKARISPVVRSYWVNRRLRMACKMRVLNELSLFTLQRRGRERERVRGLGRLCCCWATGLHPGVC